jgi:hypothetical protein
MLPSTQVVVVFPGCCPRPPITLNGKTDPGLPEEYALRKTCLAEVLHAVQAEVDLKIPAFNPDKSSSYVVPLDYILTKMRRDGKFKAQLQQCAWFGQAMALVCDISDTTCSLFSCAYPPSSGYAGRKGIPGDVVKYMAGLILDELRVNDRVILPATIGQAKVVELDPKTRRKIEAQEYQAKECLDRFFERLKKARIIVESGIPLTEFGDDKETRAKFKDWDLLVKDLVDEHCRKEKGLPARSYTELWKSFVKTCTNENAGLNALSTLVDTINDGKTETLIKERQRVLTEAGLENG